MSFFKKIKEFTNKDFTMVVREKKEMLDVLEQCMELLGRLDEDVRMEWRSTGEMEQLTRWNDETRNTELVYKDEDGNKTFEDTGVPYMKEKYDNLPKLEYSERDEARIAAIQKVRETLAALA